MSKASLSLDKDFKARVLDEQPDKIDVRRRARQSLQEVGVAHLALRGIVAEQVARARAGFDAAIRDYKDAGAESDIGLCARRADDSDTYVPVLLNWDDVRLRLAEKNDCPPRLWPRRTHREPKAEQIIALRKEAQHTQAQAAAAVFVSVERWQDYEDGLAMPEGLFHLYQLQVGRHRTHSLHLSSTAKEQDQQARGNDA